MNKRIINKRTFYNYRSKLKHRIKNGAVISKKLLKQYHLSKKEHKLYVRGRNSNSKRYQLTIKIPKSFSFIYSQNNTSKFLSALKKKLSNNEIAYDLYIDHTENEIISIDASFLFDAIINQYINKWKSNRIKIKLSGKVSRNRDINNFLLSFGLFSTINIIAKQICPSYADISYKKQFIHFKKAGNSMKPYLAGNACTELADFFDRCFIDNGFKIKDEAKGYLIDTFGEIIRNAEEHSSNNIDNWNVIGCYSKKNHICSFSIINRGISFFESLSATASKASTALDEVDNILLKQRNFITKMIENKEQYIENIWTMMALQDGISSKREKTGKSSSRGLGMMDVISFIDGIRNKENKKSCLKIISGRTSILIDYSFPIIKKENGYRRSMIFNKTQDLHLPPEKKYINSIDIKFPGTIISADFMIDQEYLSQQIDGGKNEK
nr:hypothetical protein [uncultured Treponema sp.]